MQETDCECVCSCEIMCMHVETSVLLLEPSTKYCVNVYSCHDKALESGTKKKPTEPRTGGNNTFTLPISE